MKELIEQILKKQESNVVFYMNTYMTQEERDRHGSNIWNLLAKPEPTIAWLELNEMANGINTIHKIEG
jgi:hypothetical protein